MATITNEDWNPVQSKIASVTGTPDGTINDLGYNVSPTSAQVPDLQVITGAQWNALRTDVNRCYTLQTGSNSDLTTRGTADKITQADLTTMSARVDTAYNNRGSVSTGQLTTVNKGGYSFSGGWSSSVGGTGSISWANNATYRGFWNAGGRIILSFSRTGGSANSQKQAWTNLCSNSGSLVLTRTGMFQSGQTWNGVFENSWNTGGAYGQRTVTPYSRSFYILAQDTNYTANYIEVFFGWDFEDVKSATKFNWTVNFIDGHLPSGAGPDTVDGTIEMTVVAQYPFSNAPL